MKIFVYKERFNWYMECDEHDTAMTTEFWADAYEAALGHACMAHPRVGRSIDRLSIGEMIAEAWGPQVRQQTGQSRLPGDRW